MKTTYTPFILSCTGKVLVLVGATTLLLAGIYGVNKVCQIWYNHVFVDACKEGGSTLLSGMLPVGGAGSLSRESPRYRNCSHPAFAEFMSSSSEGPDKPVPVRRVYRRGCVRLKTWERSGRAFIPVTEDTLYQGTAAFSSRNKWRWGGRQMFIPRVWDVRV